MADKNILMQRKKGDGTYDAYYPQTKVANVAGAAKQSDLEALAGPGRTTETVKGNADALTSHKADYATHLADGASHSKTARFVVGTSTAGWTLEDCDYLCDGTNDQVEINNAIDDLPTNGGEIIILDGVYKSEGITIDNRQNITLRGNGDATKLETRQNVHCLFIKDSNNISINNLKIEDTWASYNHKRNGIVVSNSKAVRIDKVTVDDFFKGIEVLSESENICIENSTVYGGERECVYIENTYQCRVDNCLLVKALGLDRAAINFITNCKDILFTNNYIDSLYGGITTRADRGIIIGNIIKAVGRSIYFFQSNRNIAIGNVVTGGEIVQTQDTLTTVANNNYQELGGDEGV